MNSAHERILRYFKYTHLPEPLQFASQPICDVAEQMAKICENSDDPAEVTVGLRRLLEAKDCFVRAMVK